MANPSKPEPKIPDWMSFRATLGDIRGITEAIHNTVMGSKWGAILVWFEKQVPADQHNFINRVLGDLLSRTTDPKLRTILLAALNKAATEE